MVRLAQERILLVGDTDRQLDPALATAVPSAHVTRVDSLFDAIAELTAHDYSAIVANAEPIERRPEAAIRTLRELAGDSRIILFGHPTLEPVSRRMLEFGCDDYVIAPPSAAELSQVFALPLMRLAPTAADTDASGQSGEPTTTTSTVPSADESAPSVLHEVPVADILLEALVQHPGAAHVAAIKTINTFIGPSFELRYEPGSATPTDSADDLVTLPVRAGNDIVAHLRLAMAPNQDVVAARHFLSQSAAAFNKLATLQERHRRLERLAITDQLTGVYNRRYFEHFLAGILEKAKSKRFQVTLLLFDIDNFKRYNDECGHGLGDEILRETATLMRLCCREHDFVARIGGDEFAVVFWEKEPPRQPKDPQTPITPGRVPLEPLQILQRFRRAISSKQFTGLGTAGRGVLTISGGLASFPWDGRDVKELVEAADRALTFGAKRGGKNSIYLVGGDAQNFDDDPEKSPA